MRVHVPVSAVCGGPGREGLNIVSLCNEGTLIKHELVLVKSVIRP